MQHSACDYAVAASGSGIHGGVVRRAVENGDCPAQWFRDVCAQQSNVVSPQELAVVLHFSATEGAFFEFGTVDGGESMNTEVDS